MGELASRQGHLHIFMVMGKSQGKTDSRRGGGTEVRWQGSGPAPVIQACLCSHPLLLLYPAFKYLEYLLGGRKERALEVLGYRKIELQKGVQTTKMSFRKTLPR